MLSLIENQEMHSYIVAIELVAVWYLKYMTNESNVTDAIMLEILKDIQNNVRKLTDDNKEIKQGVLRVRDDVHGLRGDVL